MTPDELAPQVYVPERRGSFSIESVAATRSHERLPYALGAALDDAIAQLAAGHPVLVLENVACGSGRSGTYAVLVGYDAANNKRRAALGDHRARKVIGARRFDRFWKRADRWALVVLEPGEGRPRPSSRAT